MKYLVFAPRFVGPIRAGTKDQTIRKAPRLQPGEELALRAWEGVPYRSDQVDIVPPVRVESVAPVTIGVRSGHLRVWVDGIEQTGDRLERFARRDGFEGAGDMARHYEREGRPSFQGFVVRWAPRAGGGS